MEVMLQPTDTKTNILDLKDVCLRKVFAILEPDDLAAVADVCVHFRENAVQSAGSKFKNLKLSQNISVNDYSKLRNFGKSIDSVRVVGDRSQKSHVINQKRIIELVVRYCVGETFELDLDDFDITDELAYIMQPLLGRVHELHFFRCQLDKAILTKLSLWSPELRNLEFWLTDVLNDETQLCGICQKFPNLKFIRLGQIKDVKTSDIAEFLKQNPQLKEIETMFCDKIDDSIFQSIAEYVPEIEGIHFDTGPHFGRNNIKYLGQLRELKSMFLRVAYDRPYILLVIHQIGSANIALEHLTMSEFDITQEFIEEISKLHKLKTLRMWTVDNMTTTHLFEISEHLGELTEFAIFGTDLKMNQDDLLKLVQSAKKVQRFEYKPWDFPDQVSNNIDVDTFNKLVKTVEQRSEKIPLTISLSNHFTADIPAELTKAASEFLKIEIETFE